MKNCILKDYQKKHEYLEVLMLNKKAPHRAGLEELYCNIYYNDFLNNLERLKSDLMSFLYCLLLFTITVISNSCYPHN